MKRALAILVICIFAVMAATPAEAVIGRGRSSMGSRGSRGGGQTPRRYDAPSQNRNYGNTSPNRSTPSTPPPVGGGLMRNLGAGIAGGFLGSMLFRSFGGGGAFGSGGPGGGGMGILEMLLLGALAFFGIRWFLARRQTQLATEAAFGDRGHARREDFSSTPEPIPPSEESPSEILQSVEVAFDDARFREARLDEFFQLQAAFGNRDLAPVRDAIAGEIWPQIEQDVAELRRLGQVNRMDNIAVRSTEIVDAWREPGRAYATVRFDANVIDYTIDERTNQVIEGSRTETTKFREAWTFVRELGFGKGEPLWRLSAIERETT